MAAITATSKTEQLAKDSAPDLPASLSYKAAAWLIVRKGSVKNPQYIQYRRRYGGGEFDWTGVKAFALKFAVTSFPDLKKFADARGWHVDEVRPSGTTHGKSKKQGEGECRTTA